MKFVEPIRDIKKIDAMKKLMIADENFRDHLLFTLGINSGLRISDLLSIKWTLFLNEKGKLLKAGSAITVTERKTGKKKRFKLNKSIRKAVESFYETVESVDPERYVFLSRQVDSAGTVTPISRVQAWRTLNKYAKAVGILDKIGTHTLRKTFGYHLYKKGIAVEYIQKLLNHSAASITLRYIGISQDQLDEIYVDLNL